MGFISVPFGYLLEGLYRFAGDYGLALILFSLVVKLLLAPFTAKSKKSSMKMSRLAPRMKLLQEKYANDPQKQNEAVQALYKSEGVSMGGGCLWSLLPLLIIFPLFDVIREPMVYMLHIAKNDATTIVKIIQDAGLIENTNAYGQMVAAQFIPKVLPQIQEAGIVLLGRRLGHHRRGSAARAVCRHPAAVHAHHHEGEQLPRHQRKGRAR